MIYLPQEYHSKNLPCFLQLQFDWCRTTGILPAQADSFIDPMLYPAPDPGDIEPNAIFADFPKRIWGRGFLSGFYPPTAASPDQSSFLQI
jgi:hypothetical protein